MAYPTKKEFLEITDRYLEGTASKEQIEIIEAYYQLFSEEPEVMERIDAFGLNGVEQKIRQRINKRIKAAENVSVASPIFNITKISYRIAVAAMLLISLSLGIYFYMNRSASYSAMQIGVTNDVAPGGNKAVLTLADGKKIILNDVPNGTVVSQSGMVISKTKSGELIYEVSPTIKEDKASGEFNVITTPRGGQYQVRLADGTVVWLNAESSLKFPSSFSGLKERIVELKGEAYFEVAKVAVSDVNHGNSAHRMSFFVKSGRQSVEVLGTHFNIQSYSNEGNIKTTLLEGVVRVSALNTPAVTLKPNQQAALTASGLRISDVDGELAIAWKTGLFMFNGEDLSSIMLKIARWYNVEVRFDDENLRNKVFSGSFSRFTNVSKVLQKIELTGAARFDVREGVITVYKY